MSQSIQAFTVGSITIRQHNGLYSLNDLHQASGGEVKHQPTRFMRLDTTQALIQEIEHSPNMVSGHSANMQSAASQCANLHTAVETINGGRYRGTYACKQLVISYASWISAAFHLKVLNVFLDSVTPQP